MNLARSTYYDASAAGPDNAVVVEIREIVGEFLVYGYRRVSVELRHRGQVVNSQRVRRIIRENDLNPKRKRLHVVTTDSDHDKPIYPNLAPDYEVHGPNQLWVGDITYIAVRTGFCYLAVVMDILLRKVVGYALGRAIDQRLTTAALRSAIAGRRLLLGCVFHSDRGVRYAVGTHRRILKEHGFVGSMSRRGNPYDQQAESLMKTLKVEDVYLMEYDSFEDVAADLPGFIESI